MAKRDVKGLHTVRARGREYTYAWRGGPRIHGKPGTPHSFGRRWMRSIASGTFPSSENSARW
jgi:hypothetical protein